MQQVTAAFTVEEKKSVRSISQNTQVSWKRESILGNITFTIGVSYIGMGDVIGINPDGIANPGSFKYFDESDYVMGLSVEHNLSQPIGGVNKSMASMTLDNTTGRFTPRYMGGSSELFTAIESTKPVIYNAGFYIDGVPTSIPQFSGIISKTPEVDVSSKTLRAQATDYLEYFQNRYIDRTTMFTGVTSDVVIESLLSQLGMATAQYNLDQGINQIPFVYFDNGTKFADAIAQLVQAENGQFFQDETGVFKFENRQHWYRSPYNEVQKIILTSQVINSKAPTTDHIINVVEVNANPRVKATEQIYALSGTITLNSGITEVFIDFENPVLASNAPVFTVFKNSDGTGTNLTSQVTLSVDQFAKTAKLTFNNTSSYVGYVTSLTISGRWAVERYAEPIYTRVVDSSSVTAYQEHPLTINNDFIQDSDWANSFGQIIVDDYGEPENILEITIRAIPELQRGDLISWQGRYWRVYGIKTTISANEGYVQELRLVQRNLTTYFMVGVSDIGGTDVISA